MTESVYMKTLILFSALFLTTLVKAQVISNFTWSTAPLTTANVGPNGTSVSSSATSQYVGGAIGYALNPGLPNKNVDLVVPGSPTFDVNGIEVELYFRREESVASFWKRGSVFNFGMNSGFLTVTFTTTQGSTPGNLLVNSGNIATIVDDHQFHNYRFRYDNNTGVANVWVDNVVVYTYNGVAGRPLSWTGAGNVVIGDQMDATSRNVPTLANLTVRNVQNAVLPVKLISFTAAEKNNKTVLQWTASNETNFLKFVIEHSADGKKFTTIATVAATGNAGSVARYQSADEHPFNGANYYRLKLTDTDGSFTYSATIEKSTACSANCFPNPAGSFVNLMVNEGSYDYSINTLQGNIVEASTANGSQLRINLGMAVPSGVLIIRLHNRRTNTTQSFRILKS